MKKARIKLGRLVDCVELRSEVRGFLFKKRYVLVAYLRNYANDDGSIAYKNTITEWIPEEDLYDVIDTTTDKVSQAFDSASELKDKLDNLSAKHYDELFTKTDKQ